MAANSYDLNFGGYWREPNIEHLPAESGIYGVYRCVHNADKTVALKRLLYIGEAANVRDRVKDHEKWPEWRRYLESGEQLCFNAAPISPKGDRERAEAAMIYKHKPPCNTEYKDSFPFDETTITTRGRSDLMHAHFTVYRTQAATG